VLAPELRVTFLIRPSAVIEELRELGRVLIALPGIEVARWSHGPAAFVPRLRPHGRGGGARTPEGRTLLQRVIAAVDARLPGEPNCYRRALLESSLDAGAAEEPLRMGLKLPGGPRSGHAWLGGSADADRGYDVRVEI